VFTVSGTVRPSVSHCLAGDGGKGGNNEKESNKDSKRGSNELHVFAFLLLIHIS
jgi:hypothetical protein